VRFAPDRVAELVDHVLAEDRPGYVDTWLRNTLLERSDYALRRSDYAAAMDACLAALRGEPGPNSLLRLEDTPIAVPVSDDSASVARDLARFLQSHSCTWIATGDLVRARRLVERVLRTIGYQPRTWTAALRDFAEFTPGMIPQSVDGDPSVAALGLAFRDEPGEPTGYLLVDLDTNTLHARISVCPRAFPRVGDQGARA
jgi:hypothetical protein